MMHMLMWAMQDPVSRNRYYGGYPGHPQTFYDAMSLNSNVLPYAAGICGGQVGQTVRACLTCLLSPCLGDAVTLKLCSRSSCGTSIDITAHKIPT